MLLDGLVVGCACLCCTVDKAPDGGHLLVLDEAHWIFDTDRGRHWTGVAGLAPDRRLVGAAAQVAPGDVPSDLPHRTPRLRPTLEDPGVRSPGELVDGLRAWHAWARRGTAAVGAAADDVTPLIDRLLALLPGVRGPEAEVADVALVWRLVCLPIDFDPPRRTRWLDLSTLARRHLAGRRSRSPHLASSAQGTDPAPGLTQGSSWPTIGPGGPALGERWTAVAPRRAGAGRTLLGTPSACTSRGAGC